MGILSWNTSGIGRKRFKKQVKGLLKNDKSTIILIETGVNRNKAEQIVKSIIISYFIEISVEGFCGRIWLLWTYNALFTKPIDSFTIKSLTNLNIYLGRNICLWLSIPEPPKTHPDTNI